ncbi:hypothetical protein [Actinotalea sp. K2]|uniref:hypothetical protein n=1 Tax=Actinotalea sp. K2 TaxID=2939438 RepID=UPI002016E886|nr:hypothetical protein [Actinotalea sp. K2]MCL3859690.1 hypothetical protein [Actinotalea sp. K2]
MRISHRLALVAGFLAVHGWLTWLGTVAVPGEAFHDVDLYRSWARQGLDHGWWPVLDTPWVYPAGAVVVVLLPGLVASTPLGYALVWCALVTAVDAAVVVLLVRTGRPAAAWWWLGFLVLLGPVAVGRLDAVVVPLMIVALLHARTRPRWAAALLTAGAWVKVAPGALMLPLVVAARRPVRDVVLPAAVVCAVVVAAVTAGGGLSRIATFLTTQQGRGLQIEAVGATPWMVAAGAGDPHVTVALDPALVTYQVTGPGTALTALVLDVVLVGSVLTVALTLAVARRRGRALDVLLPGALTLLAVLVVANKVGSPQLVGWLAAPVVVMLHRTHDDPPVAADRRVVAVLVLGAAGLTQVLFPWGYPSLLAGDPWATGVLVVRNLMLVVVLGCAVRLLRTASAPLPGPRSPDPTVGRDPREQVGP